MTVTPFGHGQRFAAEINKVTSRWSDMQLQECRHDRKKGRPRWIDRLGQNKTEFRNLVPLCTTRPGAIDWLKPANHRLTRGRDIADPTVQKKHSDTPWHTADGSSIATTFGILRRLHLYIFLVAFTFLHVRTARQQLGNAYFGAAVGLAHYAGASSIARISAGACNPALGLAFVLAGLVPGWMILIYLLAGLIGGGAASVFYRMLNPND